MDNGEHAALTVLLLALLVAVPLVEAVLFTSDRHPAVSRALQWRNRGV